jgi:hypothetical protein
MPKARKKIKQAKQAVPNPADFLEVARGNPYVHRLLEDSSIRDNAQRAFESTRRAVDRLSRAKNPAKALIDDKRLQNDLRTALEAIRDASTSLTEGPKRAKKQRKRGRGLRKLVLLGGLGGGAALAASEELRGKVLDLLFGAEEEFEYTPPTDAAPAASPPPVAAS